MNRFSLVKVPEVNSEGTPFGELLTGEGFESSGSVYIKADLAVVPATNEEGHTAPVDFYCRYNCVNLRTLRVGLYKDTTKVKRVKFGPLEYSST